MFELFRELVVELAPDPKSINLVFAGLGRVLELPTVIGVSWTSLMLKVRLRLTLANDDRAANL